MTAVFDPNTGQWTTRPGLLGGGPAPAGTTIGPGGTYLNTPTAAQTVEGRVNALSNSNSELMQRGAKEAQGYAGARGLLNSTLAAQAGRTGALSAVMPIAQADAQIAAQANAQNADALNAVNIANMNRMASTSVGGAYVGGNAIDADIEFERQKEIMRLASSLNISEADAGRIFQREQADLDRGLTREESAADRGFRSGESALDRGFRSGESALDRGLTREEWGQQRDEAERDRGWRSSEAERDRAFANETMTRESRLGMFRDVLSQSMGTIFSSPDFFRDPASASGFLEFFTTQFGSLFDRFFTPGGG